MSESNSRSVSSRKQKTIKTNQNSFKLNVLEANKEEDLKRDSQQVSKFAVDNEFMSSSPAREEGLKQSQSKTAFQDKSFQRRRSIKKG